MDRVESPTARKFAQGVVGIHTNEDRNPSDVFRALSRAVSYAGVGTGDEMITGGGIGTSAPCTFFYKRTNIASGISTRVSQGDVNFKLFSAGKPKHPRE
jgi:hypothetical protein